MKASSCQMDCDFHFDFIFWEWNPTYLTYTHWIYLSANWELKITSEINEYNNHSYSDTCVPYESLDKRTDSPETEEIYY